MFENINVGMTQTFQKEVTREDSALNYGSGVHKHLLATPSLVAFMIECTTKMIDPKLPTGYVTVGKNINVEHISPTAKGLTVTVEAVLARIVDNHLYFDITVYDQIGKIALGTHERLIVNYDIFMTKVEDRCKVLTRDNLRVDLNP